MRLPRGIARSYIDARRHTRVVGLMLADTVNVYSTPHQFVLYLRRLRWSNGAVPGDRSLQAAIPMQTGVGLRRCLSFFHLKIAYNRTECSEESAPALVHSYKRNSFMCQMSRRPFLPLPLAIETISNTYSSLLSEEHCEVVRRFKHFCGFKFAVDHF